LLGGGVGDTLLLEEFRGAQGDVASHRRASPLTKPLRGRPVRCHQPSLVASSCHFHLSDKSCQVGIPCHKPHGRADREGASMTAPVLIASSAPPLRDQAGARRRKVTDARMERLLLLDAAMRVLERTGWWGFKVDSVLRQARLSTRSFYRHFEKKNDLLLALLEHEINGVTVHIERL